MQRLRLDPVDLDVELRHHRTERGADALQRALASVRWRRSRRAMACSLSKSELPSRSWTCMAKPAALPMPWIGGGGITSIRASRITAIFSFNPTNSERRSSPWPALAPFFQDQIGDAGIGEARRVVERRDAGDGDHLLDARGTCRRFPDLIDHVLGAVERRAIGQLRGDQQIALVLDRNEAGRHPRQAVAGDADQRSARISPRNCCARQAADQPCIAPLDAVIDRVEAAIEEVALFRRHRPAQPQARTASASASRR